MFTIDRLAKLDAIANAVFKALNSGLDWLDLKYEDFLTNTAYRVVEAKERAIRKAEEKISALEDSRSELVAKHQIALIALADEIYEREDALLADLAQAAHTLAAAGKDYDATIQAASDKLGVEIES